MSSLKTLLSSRWFQITLAVIVTGILTALFLNETIIKRTREETVLKEKTLTSQLTQTQEKLLLAERELQTHSTSTTNTTTKPDGTIISSTIIVVDTKLVERVREEERQRTEELLASKESEWRRKFEELSVHKNPKRLSLFAGIDVNPRHTRSYSGGFQYKLWGPITVGFFGTSTGMVGPSVGLTF